MPIDRAARNKLAESIRALVAGIITNDEFESRMPEFGNDIAIREVFSKGAWYLYSDHSEYRLRGRHRLDNKSKAAAARWVFFLKTDLPYEWPLNTVRSSLFQFAANLLSFGIANKYFRQRFSTYGDVEVWPFLRKDDYAKALQNPVYLIAGT